MFADNSSIDSANSAIMKRKCCTVLPKMVCMYKKGSNSYISVQSKAAGRVC